MRPILGWLCIKHSNCISVCQPPTAFNLVAHVGFFRFRTRLCLYCLQPSGWWRHNGEWPLGLPRAQPRRPVEKACREGLSRRPVEKACREGLSRATARRATGGPEGSSQRPYFSRAVVAAKAVCVVYFFLKTVFFCGLYGISTGCHHSGTTSSQASSG